MKDRLPLILSSAALLVAIFGSTPLGNAAYEAIAPNSITAVQLRDGAVTNAKLRGDAVTSGKVLDGSLKAIDFKAGQLPAGPKGEKGDKGDRGPKGDDAAVTCPSGTSRFVSVCIEKTFREPATWSDAGDICARAKRRLPSPGELNGFRRQSGITLATPGEWTDDLGDITYKPTFVFFAITQNGNGVREAFTAGPFRCVAGLQAN